MARYIKNFKIQISLLFFFIIILYPGQSASADSCICITTITRGGRLGGVTSNPPVYHEDAKSFADCKKYESIGITINTTCTFGASTNSTPQAPETPIKYTPIAPQLQINIPTIQPFTTEGMKTPDASGNIYVPFIGQYIAGIFKYAVLIAGLVAVVLIIIGGFVYATSAGSSERATAGKERITSALTGLLILLSSYAILYIINPNLVKFQSLKIKVIESVNLGDYFFEGSNTYTGQIPSATPSADVKKIITAYSSCFSIDPGVTLAIAAVESGFRSNAVSPSKLHLGLFQMTDRYCRDGLAIGKYSSLNLDCANRFDPETNTAAAVATIDQNIKVDIMNPQKCGSNIDFQTAIILLYVAHNNGPQVMRHAIEYAKSQGGCSQDNLKKGVADFYISHGGTYRTVTTQKGLEKYQVGVKVAVAAKTKYGAKELYQANPDKSLCPKTTGQRALQNKSSEPNQSTPTGKYCCVIDNQQIGMDSEQKCADAGGGPCQEN